MNPPTATTAPPPTLPAGRYRIDPDRTSVLLHTRHMFGLGAVTGTVALREAELTVGEATGATRLRAVLDSASFETGDAGELVLRASATIDRYAHQVTAGKGLAARRVRVEITATATPHPGARR